MTIKTQIEKENEEQEPLEEVQSVFLSRTWSANYGHVVERDVSVTHQKRRDR